MEGSRIPVSLDNPPVHFLMIAYTGISQSFKGLRVWSLERIIISIIQNRRRRVPARGENKNKNVARSRKQTPTFSLVHILFLRFPQCPHCMVLSPKRVRVARWEYMQTARCSEQKFRVHSDVHGRHTSPCRTVGLTPHFPHTVGLMPRLPVTQLDACLEEVNWSHIPSQYLSEVTIPCSLVFIDYLFSWNHLNRGCDSHSTVPGWNPVIPGALRLYSNERNPKWD